MRAAYTDHCATSTSSPTALSRSSFEHHEVKDPSSQPLQFGDSLRQEESLQWSFLSFSLMHVSPCTWKPPSLPLWLRSWAGLAEIPRGLLGRSSVVPGRSAVLSGIAALLWQLILPSSPTVKLRVKTDQWTACFIFPLTNTPTKGKRSVTSPG